MMLGPIEIIIVGIFLMMFVFAAVAIALGFWTTFRISGKVFQAVERELDRKATEQANDSKEDGKPKCAHCGTVTNAETCPSCGARVV